VNKLGVGQVAYTHWCDGAGKVIDDGTLARLDEQLFRWTAAEPNLRWIKTTPPTWTCASRTISERPRALALQGPTSREL
jgi:aminomethyltransferase